MQLPLKFEIMVYHTVLVTKILLHETDIPQVNLPSRISGMKSYKKPINSQRWFVA